MAELHPDIERILLSEEEIRKIVKNIADKINNDFRSEERRVGKECRR